MREASFNADELRAELEEKWGGGRKFEIFEMVRQVSRPENFCVKTADGERFLAKCVPQHGAVQSSFHTAFLPHLKELAGVRIATQLVYGPIEWNGCTVVGLSWCGGGRILPDCVTDVQRRGLIRAYGEFSDAIQGTRVVRPMRDSVKERNAAIEKLSVFGCGILRRFLEREISEDSLRYDESKLRVIHGDFHHGNFHFDGDEVSGIMDFEEFRRGYAADDWVRYLLVGAEHLNWFDFAGRKRIVDFFMYLLPLYTIDEWKLAVNAFYVRKIFRRFSKKRNGLTYVFWAWKMVFRLRFYHRLCACLDGVSSS